MRLQLAKSSEENGGVWNDNCWDHQFARLMPRLEDLVTIGGEKAGKRQAKTEWR